MLIQRKSEFSRTPVLDNSAVFSCVQCGYCWYLIVGGSGKELLEEKKRHAIECKATHGLIGVVNRTAHRQKPRALRGTRVLRWITALFYHDCEVVMNAPNIVTFWITVISSFLPCSSIHKRTPPKPTHCADLELCHSWLSQARTSPAARGKTKLKVTDFVVGSDLTYMVNGNKAKLKTRAANR